MGLSEHGFDFGKLLDDFRAAQEKIMDRLARAESMMTMPEKLEFWRRREPKRRAIEEARGHMELAHGNGSTKSWRVTRENLVREALAWRDFDEKSREIAKEIGCRRGARFDEPWLEQESTS